MSARTEADVLALDEQDPLRSYRDRFCIPPAPGRDDGSPSIYFCGNSLGCMPKSARDAVTQELDDWAHFGVEGHFDAKNPWFPYHEVFRDMGARLVGAIPGEVVMMNSLTVNQHLMMVTFYRPTPERYKIVIEDTAFPSDSYAMQSQAEWHGFDPADAVVRLKPREGEHTLRTEDVLAFLDREGERVAVMMMGGVNYLTGQWFDMPAITAAARAKGCTVGWDLAHAAGNVPLHLHDWDVDFAIWCTYKYLNSGPGAVAGCFVHERHATNTKLPRFAGWWGNDPKARFVMGPDFEAAPSADGWQLSNPPIMAMAPVKASMEIFDEVGMDRLRAKSEQLTSTLESLIEGIGSDAIEIITPRDVAARGCQLSLLVHREAKAFQQSLIRSGVICDFREPNVVRVAPTPLYNTFHETWKFAEILRAHVT